MWKQRPHDVTELQISGIDFIQKLCVDGKAVPTEFFACTQSFGMSGHNGLVYGCPEKGTCSLLRWTAPSFVTNTASIPSMP